MKPITPQSPVHLYNKLFYWSGDNYLSHIIKHLEQIGGSNYRLPLGYPSSFIVFPLYITWWDLLCCAFPLHFSVVLCRNTLTKRFGGQKHSFKVLFHLLLVFRSSWKPPQTKANSHHTCYKQTNTQNKYTPTPKGPQSSCLTYTSFGPKMTFYLWM